MYNIMCYAFGCLLVNKLNSCRATDRHPLRHHPQTPPQTPTQTPPQTPPQTPTQTPPQTPPQTPTQQHILLLIYVSDIHKCGRGFM